ncbi:MAG: response regulator [Microcystaceae cyanobacterium]
MSDVAKILLVDDEPGVRESVKAFLEYGEEFTVKDASNANEAWEQLQQDTPDLIISDIMMPEVDGYQFLEQVRNDPRYQSLPVIFLTARGMTSDRIQGYDAGCDAYLSKPFDPDELESLIKNILKRRQVSEVSQGESSKLDEIYQELLDIKQKMGNNTGMITTPPPFQIDLTPREKSVLDLVAEGLMNKEIAARLNTSVRNVEKYVSRLFSKTGTNSRTELVRFALKHGLTQ